jgi:transposase
VAVELRLEGVPGLVARLFRELIARRREPTARIGELRAEIQDLVTPVDPRCPPFHGCGALSAAKIIGETAGIQRFRSEDTFARHNGTALIPVWPANQVRHRPNPARSRRLNAALHRIALTQARHDPNVRVYFDRLRAAGNITTEAIRCLKRRLSDAVYRARLADEPAPGSATRLLVA